MPTTQRDDAPFVSVIVPVFRSAPEVLSEVLGALSRVDYPRDRREILVIDNDLEGQRELEAIVGRFHPEACYLRSPQRGAHSARNYGLLRARGEYCYFVDDDVLVDSSCMRALLSAMADGTVGAAGGKIRPLWRGGAPPEWINLFLDSTYVVRESYREVLVAAGVSNSDDRLNLGLLSLLDLGDRRLDVDDGWLYSCNLMVKTSAAVAAGGFDPDLIGPHALGDNEMGLLRRIAASGLRLRYEPTAIVTHVISASRLTMRYFARRTFNDGSCDAYIQLREGHVRGRAAVMKEAAVGLGLGMVSIVALGLRAAGREARWRRLLTNVCTHFGAAHYYLVYLISSHRRELVHQSEYLSALTSID